MDDLYEGRFTKLKKENTWGVRISDIPNSVSYGDVVRVRVVRSNGRESIRKARIIWIGEDKFSDDTADIAIAKLVESEKKEKKMKQTDTLENNSNPSNTAEQMKQLLADFNEKFNKLIEEIDE